MKSIRKKAVFALMFGVLLITTGCLGDSGSVGAEDIRNSSIKAMESIDTYAFNTETDLKVKPVEGHTNQKLSITAFVRGTASESIKRMRTSSNFVVNKETIDQETYSRAPNSSTEKMETYVRLRNSGDENNSRWYKLGNAYVSSTPVENHVQLLETSKINSMREGTLKNQSVHILSMDADTEEYKSFSIRKVRNLMLRAGVLVNDQGLLNKAKIGNASLRYWISQDTNRVIRVKSTANISTSVPNAKDKAAMTMKSVTTFSSYGGEINVETPEGIGNATEFEKMFSESSATSNQSRAS